MGAPFGGMLEGMQSSMFFTPQHSNDSCCVGAFSLAVYLRGGAIMLILRRKKEESVYIDTPLGRVTITVLGLGPGTVKLGFDSGEISPEAIPIYRAELPQERCSSA